MVKKLKHLVYTTVNLYPLAYKKLTHRALMSDHSLNNVLSNHSGIGIFGGTFDPIHLGHIQTCEAVTTWLNLSQVLFIPAHIPPHKKNTDNSPHASPEQRAAMVELACQPYSDYHCDRIELSRHGDSYTVDTLTALKQKYPERPLYFIIGMDSLLSFTKWYKYQEILTLCHLVVNTRPNYSLETLNDSTKSLLESNQIKQLSQLNAKHSGGIIFSPPLHVDISSTIIRQMLMKNECCKKLLSPQVLDFIDKNSLYR